MFAKFHITSWLPIKNIVYLIQCKKCKWAQYIGETQETLETRIGQHLGYISRIEEDKPVGRHFNLKGHSAADMEVLVLEKIHQSDAFYRKEREHLQIQNFDLVRKGLNGKKWICKLQLFLKILPHNLQLGKLVLCSFWYETISMLILFCYYDYCLKREA